MDMKRDKLFLVVTELGSSALPLTLPIITSCFNDTGVVKGCIIIFPCEFTCKTQIELANEHINDLSSLFDFSIVINHQTLSKDFIGKHSFIELENWFTELWKSVASLITYVHSSNSLNDLRNNLKENDLLKQLLNCGVLYITRNKDIDFSFDKRTLLIGLGSTGATIAKDVYQLTINNMEVLGLGIGTVGECGNNYELDLTGEWNYPIGIDKDYKNCKRFVENNIDVIKDVIECFLGFDTSHQPDIPYSKRIKGIEAHTYQEYQKQLYSVQKQPPSFDNGKTTIIDVLLFSITVIGIIYIAYILAMISIK